MILRYFLAIFHIVFCLLRERHYTSLCRGLEYLLKKYRILSKMIFETVFFFWAANNALCLKKISQKWAAFAFGSTYLHQTFTDLCLINVHISVCQHCQMWLQVMEGSLIYFFLNFRNTICESLVKIIKFDSFFSILIYLLQSQLLKKRNIFSSILTNNLLYSSV